MVLSGIMAGIDYSFCGVGGFYGSVGIHLAGCRVFGCTDSRNAGNAFGSAGNCVRGGIAVCLVFTRPFVKRVLAVKKVNTNADRTIGEIGLVTETIDSTLESGRVMVDGLSWKARTSDNAVLEAGTRVQVKEIHGVTLTVEKAV